MENTKPRMIFYVDGFVRRGCVSHASPTRWDGLQLRFAKKGCRQRKRRDQRKRRLLFSVFLVLVLSVNFIPSSLSSIFILLVSGSAAQVTCTPTECVEGNHGIAQTEVHEPLQSASWSHQVTFPISAPQISSHDSSFVKWLLAIVGGRDSVLQAEFKDEYVQLAGIINELLQQHRLVMGTDASGAN